MTGGPQRIDRGPVTALILAGERGGANPLAQAAGVGQKCWVPAGGVPMLLRVVETLGRCRAIGRIAVSLMGAATEQERQALTERAAGAELVLLASADSPSASVLAALETLDGPYPLLVTTADHALLSDEIVEHFWRACELADGDVAAAVVPASVIQRAYPETRRTYLRFADGPCSGANLFALLRPAGRRAVEFWRRIERNRKRPWRLIGAFGLLSLTAYLFGRLTAGRAAQEASRIFGAEAAIIDLPFAEAAIDVDKPADLGLVDRILKDREQGHVSAGASL